MIISNSRTIIHLFQEIYQ